MIISNKIRKTLLKLSFVFLVMATIHSCNKDDEQKADQDTELVSPSVYITSPENRSAIYIDGMYSGEDTPYKFSNFSLGHHTIGIGQYKSENYLEREVLIEKIEKVEGQDPVVDVEITIDDLQQARIWKVLYVGVNKVRGIDNSGSVRELEYTTEELDMGYEFLKYSFQNYAEPYSYNTIKWEYDRIDIDQEILQLDIKNFITPDIIEPYLKKMGVKRGDYDFIMTWYRYQYEPSSEWDAPKDLGHFNGIGWFNKTSSYTRASYMLIRYYADLEAELNKAKQQDPGMIVHEWLHTVQETFYPGLGVPQMDPKEGGGSSLHALEQYGYSWPWMKGYKELMRGQIKEKSYSNSLNIENEEYVGMTPADYIETTVRDEANYE